MNRFLRSVSRPQTREEPLEGMFARESQGHWSSLLTEILYRASTAMVDELLVGSGTTGPTSLKGSRHGSG